MLEFEQQAFAGGFRRVAGVDEAGRGPLAGPVVAAAVVFDPEYLAREEHGRLATLTDSKQLTERRRDHFHELITACPQAIFGIGMATEREIDTINILKATHLAMSRALEALPSAADFALVDGLDVPGLPCPSRAIVKGDALSLSIAAASVIAKVTRDRLMADLDRQYPAYGFGRHKGYGTREHVGAIRKHGPCPAHRRTFQPIRDMLTQIELFS